MPGKFPPWLRLGLRTTLVLAASAGCMALAFQSVDAEAVGETLAKANPKYLLICASLLLCNVIIICLRFRLVLGSFGYAPPLRRLFIAFSIGQLANQIILNIIGQSLSRATVLTTNGVPFGATIVATFVERLLSVGTLLGMSIAAAWFLMPDFGFEIHQGGVYFVSVLGGIAAVVIVTLFVLRTGIDLASRFLVLLRQFIRFWFAELVTLIAHICMLGAYITALIGAGFDFNSITLETVAALPIVMFAASLPISFAGWGIREFSAIAALGVAGVAPTTALSAAVLVGGLSFAIMMLFSVAGAGLYLFPGKVLAPVPRGDSQQGSLDSWNNGLTTACATLMALTVFFQVRVELDEGAISGNIADLFALVGLGTAILLVVSRRSNQLFTSTLIKVMAVISCVIALGLIVSYIQFGSNDWAMINRGFGWVIFAGYVSVGASIVGVRGEQGRLLAIKVFSVAGLVIAASQLVMFVVFRFDGSIPSGAFKVPLEGYSNNSNAFAVQMVLTAIGVYIAVRQGAFTRRPNILWVSLWLTGTVIYYSNSRAGLGMFAILLILLIALSPRERWLRVLKSVTVTASSIGATILVLGYVPTVIVSCLFKGTGCSFNFNYQPGSQIGTRFVRPSSDTGRWATITDAWSYWFQSPIIGNGLGAYVESQLVAGQSYLVIHSVPLWLLAEMGILGLFSIAFAYGILFWRARQMARDSQVTGWGSGLLILLTGMAAASFVHDFFYQRAFWFLLGLGFALPPVLAGVSGKPNGLTRWSNEVKS